MTVKRLEEYADIRREIRDLERRIERCRRGKAFDVVQGSPDFPYAKQQIIVRGIGRRSVALATKLRGELEAKREQLEERALEVEAFLDTVDDSKVRQIIRLYYIDGLPWTATANRVYGHPGGDAARKRVVRYFEKNMKMSVLSVFETV